MTDKDAINMTFGDVHRRMLFSLLISWLLPLLLYLALRRFFPNDATTLALVGAIPVLRTASLLVWRRKVDWVGLIGIFGFAMAFTITLLSNGSSLPLKLYRPIITGVIGLTFLGSAAIGRPILPVLIRMFGKNSNVQSGDMQNVKKLKRITALLGLIFIADALIHIIMALTLPTTVYLSVSKVVTIIAAVLLILCGRLFIRYRTAAKK